jgi:hypothetical protein
MREQHDESPLYIFDSTFADREPSLGAGYKPPEFFPEDLMASMDKRLRPNYRWIVAGPARSGASWHVDPYGTSAWNALLQGRKRWALYPPHVIPPGISLFFFVSFLRTFGVQNF